MASLRTMIAVKTRQIAHRILGTEPILNEHLRWGASYVASRQIEGDYFEFGVHEGASFAYAFKMLERERAAMESQSPTPLFTGVIPPTRYFAFDSFQGLPAPVGIDRTDKMPSHWTEGAFSASKGRFVETLKDQHVDLRRVELVEGWFDSTLTDETVRRFSIGAGSIFHVDCDYYESTKDVLSFITDLFVDGSLLIFDDWTGFRGNPKYGEQRAFYEWQEKHQIKASEFMRSRGQSLSFILHRD